MRERIHYILRHKNRPYTWLFLGIASFSILGWLINSFQPDSTMIIFVMFGLMGFSLGSVLYFFLLHVRHTFLVTLGVVLVLALRVLDLHEPAYIILLAATLFSLELYLKKQ